VERPTGGDPLGQTLTAESSGVIQRGGVDNARGRWNGTNELKTTQRGSTGPTPPRGERRPFDGHERENLELAAALRCFEQLVFGVDWICRMSARSYRGNIEEPPG